MAGGDSRGSPLWACHQAADAVRLPLAHSNEGCVAEKRHSLGAVQAVNDGGYCLSPRQALLHPPSAQVVWLDSVAARARYGRWMGGVLPEFLPFPKTGKARGGSKLTAYKGGGSSSGNKDSQEGSAAGRDAREEGAYLNLRRLRYASDAGATQLLGQIAPATV